MELRHLRYFVAVAEELNFTRASEKLRVAQPSLTRQIRNLEAELEVRLLNRTNKRISLTDEGRTFLGDAKRLVELSLESVKTVQRVSRGEAGHLNLGYLFKYNFDLLPSTLATMHQQCPEISVNLFDMVPAAQITALEARKIDLGFVGLNPHSNISKSCSNLLVECISRHNLVVALPAKHPLTRKKKLKFEDLKSLFFVVMSEQTHPGTRAWLTALCQESGFIPRILQDVELESDLMKFVADGFGITLAREEIQSLPHRGVEFRPLDPTTKAEFWVAWHRDNASKPLSCYMEMVRKKGAFAVKLPLVKGEPSIAFKRKSI